MAKKSFLGSLARGFVKSAVNQVGRDAGKVVSNNVYGSSHSTPINTSGNNYNYNEFENSSNITFRTQTWNTGDDLLRYLISFFFCLFIPVIGALIVFIRGILKLIKKNNTLFYSEPEPIRVPDRRYTLGYRIEYVTRTKTSKIPLTNDEKTACKIKGAIYIFLAMTIGLISSIIFLIGLSLDENV